MSGSISSSNPLSYLGLPETDVPQVTIAKRTPTGNDLEGRKFGDLWVDVIATAMYAFVGASGGQAIWIFLGASPGTLSTLTGDVGGAVSPSAGNINLQGGGTGAIQFSNGGAGQLNAAVQVDNSTIKIVGNQLTATETFPWTVINSNTAAVSDNGYFVNTAGNINISLPATSAIGDTIEISEISTGTWTITQAAGQRVRLGSQQTTLGVGGSLASTQPGDSIRITCYSPNSLWVSTSSTGNITVI